MPIRRVRRPVCHHCTVVLTTDERTHYVYECHACFVREHELVLLGARDPDHPDLGWLDNVPVETGPAKRGRFVEPTVRRRVAA